MVKVLLFDCRLLVTGCASKYPEQAVVLDGDQTWSGRGSGNDKQDAFERLENIMTRVLNKLVVISAHHEDQFSISHKTCACLIPRYD